MIKTTNDQERNETWIAYLIRTLEHCVIGGRNIFPISPENTVNMSNEISEVTYTLFKDLTMNTLERFCEHCYTLEQRVRGEGLNVLSITTPTPDLRINIPEIIMKRINFVYDQPCRNIIDGKRCDHKMTNDLKSGEWMFIAPRLYRDFEPRDLGNDLNYNDKVALDMIAQTFDHDHKTYHFKFLVHHIPGTVCHFTTFCKTGTGYWHMDDLVELQRKIEANPGTVFTNPALLVYSIYSGN